MSYVRPVQALRAVFCMKCSLLMLVWDAIDDHMDETYSRDGLILVAMTSMGVSFCLPHVVAMSAFINCRGFSVLLCCGCVCELWI